MTLKLATHAGFSAQVLELPAVTLHEQWNSVVAKVGGKVFALIGNDSAAITFKVTDIAFAGLTEMAGIGQAPYFAKGGWVQVQPGALDEDTLAGYLGVAHGLIAAKLTRRDRAALGL